MKARVTVGVLLVAVVFYLGLIGWRGVQLLTQSGWIARGLGVGVLLLPVVGVAVVVRELQFGRAAGRLGRHLLDDHWPDGPPAPLPRRPSGRIDRTAADEVFNRRRADVEARPRDWQAWYRLAVAYGDAGDTRRGRRAMRHAIALERIQSTV
ncbi:MULTISPECIES: hypothetical protein [unclassified Frankia]|uniref:hypothetical protein n=1 Tax=unclassified Frankia TaxID=2632575 RepID=UPI001EF57A10|nr:MULTISPECIES: hypothetical protein [unclassified Frankia]